MSIGGLNERVIFQAPRRLPNGQGGFKVEKDNPIPIGEYWAGVKVISNQEALKYGGKRLEANIKITARDNANINANSQVIWKGNRLDIQGKTLDIFEIAPDDKRPGYIVIYAGEVV